MTDTIINFLQSDTGKRLIQGIKGLFEGATKYYNVRCVDMTRAFYTVLRSAFPNADEALILEIANPNISRDTEREKTYRKGIENGTLSAVYLFLASHRHKREDGLGGYEIRSNDTEQILMDLKDIVNKGFKPYIHNFGGVNVDLTIYNDVLRSIRLSVPEPGTGFEKEVESALKPEDEATKENLLKSAIGLVGLGTIIKLLL